MKESIREKIRLENCADVVIVPKDHKDYENIIKGLANVLELNTEEGIQTKEFLVLLCENYGIDPENAKKILGLDSSIHVECTPVLFKAAQKVQELSIGAEVLRKWDDEEMDMIVATENSERGREMREKLGIPEED